MASRQTHNSLVSHRKSLALSQVDVAYLLGTENAEKSCRHERFLRNPTLEDAFAYEVMYKRSGSELFAGLYRKVEQEVMARAKVLAGKEYGRNPNRFTAHRRKMLLDIAGVRINSLEK